MQRIRELQDFYPTFSKCRLRYMVREQFSEQAYMLAVIGLLFCENSRQTLPASPEKRFKKKVRNKRKSKLRKSVKFASANGSTL